MFPMDHPTSAYSSPEEGYPPLTELDITSISENVSPNTLEKPSPAMDESEDFTELNEDHCSSRLFQHFPNMYTELNESVQCSVVAHLLLQNPLVKKSCITKSDMKKIMQDADTDMLQYHKSIKALTQPFNVSKFARSVQFSGKRRGSN